MDSNDAADLIAEISEERAENQAAERFRNRAALLIACLAAVLAIGGLGGGNATDDMIYNNIRASDTWAFFQAKNVRQTMHELAAEALEAEIAAAGGTATPAQTARLQALRATIDRYESEPDPADPANPAAGEGKRQLMAQAQAYEAEREIASARDNNFDLAEVLLQLALVLGSVAILALNRIVLGASLVLGVLGSLLTLNGFLLLFALPL